MKKNKRKYKSPKIKGVVKVTGVEFKKLEDAKSKGDFLLLKTIRKK